MKKKNVGKTKNIVGMRAIHRVVSLLILLICGSVRVLPVTDVAVAEWQFSLDMHNVAIVRVFDAVEKKSDFVFAWDSDIKSDICKQVTVHVSDVPINVVMECVLLDSGLTYRRLDKQIVVYKVKR